MDQPTLLALAHLSDSAFQTAPFGGILVDGVGLIEGYNRAEAELAHLEPARVIGLNFFRTVAPCTGVSAFEGRFLEFVEIGDTLSESFAYYFPFAHGDANVLVSFVKRDVQNSYLIVVERVDEEVIAPLKDIYSPIVVG